MRLDPERTKIVVVSVVSVIGCLAVWVSLWALTLALFRFFGGWC